MADERTLARRYARALLDVATEKGKVDEVENDLHGLADLWNGSEEVRTLIAHPKWSRARKKEILAGLLAGKADPLTIRFVELLVDNGRLGVIEQIATEYDHISDEHQQIMKATVTSFMPLNDRQRKKLAERLQGFTSRANIELEEKVDASLLGGVIVRLGSHVIDGSVSGRLRKMKERLVLPPDEVRREAMRNAAEALK